ncbi:MAG TPA: hypothetical protein VFS40_10935 [Gemmatimonadales bacterium]|nr:hypothetical protein [Gemmatimonadales bacterium]
MPAPAPGARDAHEAIERLAAWFAERPTRQGLLAREALARRRPDDDALRARLIDALRHDTRADGSVGGSLLATAWRAIELVELGHGGDQPGAQRAVNWILTTQNKPGAYGEGCTPERHQRHVCEHFMSGFFAPALATQRVAPITLPDGKVFRVEAPARFAVSCLALRAVLQAGERRPAVEQHVASLVRLQEEWENWGGYFPPDLVGSAIEALAYAGPARQEVLRRLTALVRDHQEPDGSWANADLFHMSAALVAARTDAARRALRRAVPQLVGRQRPDGTYGPTAREERALIALRALLLATEDELAPWGF